MEELRKAGEAEKRNCGSAVVQVQIKTMGDAPYKQILAQGVLLGNQGVELKKGLWESSVYLASDNYVYHLTCEQSKSGLKTAIAGKRAVGEYLRWVDGLFRPGEIPSQENAIHYRAARKLRELL
jgi:hypothetical protein